MRQGRQERGPLAALERGPARHRPQPECGGMHSNGEPVTILIYAHGLKPLGHTICVAKFAAMADFSAPRDRVPSCFRPLNTGSC